MRENSKEYEKAVGRKQQEHGSGKEAEGRRDRERERGRGEGKGREAGWQKVRRGPGRRLRAEGKQG